jgi:hypothetical protein
MASQDCQIRASKSDEKFSYRTLSVRFLFFVQGFSNRQTREDRQKTFKIFAPFASFAVKLFRLVRVRELLVFLGADGRP